MTNRLSFPAGLVALGIASFPLPAFAAPANVTAEPPPRRSERMEQRAGFVIVPGNWEWRGGKYEWVPGRYVAERKGYSWHGDRWVQHDNKRWTLQRGGWSKDRDGDGMPDRVDRRPNDPTRQ